MIHRTFDPVEVNELLNTPEVRANLGGLGPLDASALLSDRRNLCLMSLDGGAMFAWRGPGIYEGHSFFRCRGRRAITLGLIMITTLFGTYGGKMVWGLTPVNLRHVCWFNRKLGFVSHGVMQTAEGACELFVMEA